MKDSSSWWRNGIIYQIYPRSFKDTTQNGLGDLNGVAQKLDYLAELGIDAIWLSPIYPSPDVDFGYDVADYFDIDPRFGTLSDFDNLVTQAHQRNIHIILDLVLNHTSDQHPWFKEALKSKYNPYHDWYLWQDPSADGGKPNNWYAVFGGPAWEYVASLNQYYYHMFCKEQPDLNWRNPDVKETMLNVFRFWLDRGVDGFRLDVFNMYYKHENFLDNPRKPTGLRPFDRQDHLYDVSQEDMYPLISEIREILDSYENRYVVGETFLADSEHASSYIGPDLLHAGFDYGFANSKWQANQFSSAIEKWDALHPEPKWPNYFLNNHDTPRSATRFKSDEADNRCKLLAAMHLTLRGTPFLYYGEEIGMRDIRLMPWQVQDPVGKRYWFAGQGRDGCRSPMQWDETEHAGFSNAKPWLPVHPNYKSRNVSKQLKETGSLINFYKQLINVRRQFDALNSGSIQLIPTGHSSILSYLRVYENQAIFVILNFNKDPVIFKLPETLPKRHWKILFAQGLALDSEFADSELKLQGYETLLLIGL